MGIWRGSFRNSNITEHQWSINWSSDKAAPLDRSRSPSVQLIPCWELRMTPENISYAGDCNNIEHIWAVFRVKTAVAVSHFDPVCSYFEEKKVTLRHSSLTLDIYSETFAWLRLFYRTPDLHVSLRVALSKTSCFWIASPKRRLWYGFVTSCIFLSMVRRRHDIHKNSLTQFLAQVSPVLSTEGLSRLG